MSRELRGLDVAILLSVAITCAGVAWWTNRHVNTPPNHMRLAPDDALAVSGAPDGCPADMVEVRGRPCRTLGYVCSRWVDQKKEYRCAEYSRQQRCLDEAEEKTFCIDRYEWPNTLGGRPRVFVSWFDAQALCEGRGKRLCSEDEWVLACEGPKRMPYAWGFVREPSPCNIDRVGLLADAPALLDEGTRDEELARLWQGEPSGSMPDCVSAYGVYDLNGNVDEWTAGGGERAVLHGGYWGPVRNTCRLATRSHGPKFRFYQVGFRCCSGGGSP